MPPRLPGRPPRLARVERLISLNVNGQTRRVDVLPNETLAMTLRYKLGLTGTKLGCDRAECGACTVLIDDVTHYSCSTLTQRVRGREITTVEGLESESGELQPGPTSIHGRIGPPMRLLHAGPGDGSCRSPDGEPEPDPGGGAPGDVGQSVPMRILRPLSERNHARSRGGVRWHI